MKITKKSINEAPKYIIILDTKVGSENNTDGFYTTGGLCFKTLTANNIIEAMAEAESYFNETTYLINIAEKTGVVDDNLEDIVYKEILTTRSNNNWHICDDKHHEKPYYIGYNLEYKFFDVIGAKI